MARAGRTARSWAFLALAVGPLAALADFAPRAAAGPLVAGILAAAVSGGLVATRLARPLRWIALIPPAVVALAVLALSPVSLVTELLALLGALGLLAWRAESVAEGLGARAAFGIGLPGLAAAFALAVTVALPAPGSLVGAAAGIAVAVLLGLALLLARSPDRGAPTI